MENSTRPDILPWPNHQEVVDGVVPVEAVSQDPYEFADTDDDLEFEMGGLA